MFADWWSLGASLLVCVAVLLVTWWRRYSTQFRRRGVPYIAPLPIVGNMLDLAIGKKSMPDALIELYHKFEPHPYAGVFSVMVPLILVRDPEIIRAVTVKDFEHFTDHMEFFSADKSSPLLQRMLLGLKGKEWHEMRTTLSPAFTSAKMKNMFVLIAEIGRQMVDYLVKGTTESQVSGKEDLLTLELKDFFTRVTNDVIATTAFGVKVDSLSEPNNTFYRMGRILTNLKAFTGFGYLLSPKLMQLLGIPFFNRKAMKYFTSMIYETVQTREKQGIVRPDVIHLLMEARRGELSAEEAENNETTERKTRRLTDEDIAAQAIIFFFAGFDTVSTLLTFCSYLIATHEDVQRRLQEEVDDVMHKSGGQPSYEQVMGCQYLDMVISETLRMYVPGTALDRVCVRSYQLPATESCPGAVICPGEIIWVPVHAIHHDPEYYTDPERFDPERFSPENKHLIKPFTYFPFGSGPRVCIAQRFALMEVKVVLMYLLSRFSVQVIPKTPVPLKIQPNTITLAIKGGAWLGIRRRS